MSSDFSGIDFISISAKGQFQVPKEQLEQLRFLSRNDGNRLWITRDVHENCLTIFLNDRWTVITEKLKRQQNSTREFRRLSRRVLGNSKSISIDAAGRMLVPKALRENCELKTRALFVGNGDRIEIWDRDAFDKAEQGMSEDMNANPEKYDAILSQLD